MLTVQQHYPITHNARLRLQALTVAATLIAPVCLTPIAYARQNPLSNMSTKKKVVLLAGAAALYYMWKKHKNAQNQPATVQYYQSKNGRIYYRDPKTHQAHWVTPPSGGIQVPADEAQSYSGYRGYNNSTSGQQFGGY